MFVKIVKIDFLSRKHKKENNKIFEHFTQRMTLTLQKQIPTTQTKKQPLDPLTP